MPGEPFPAKTETFHPMTKTLSGAAFRRNVGHVATYAALVSVAILLLVHPAAAQTVGGSGSLTTFLQNIANLITGTTGQVIAVIAVALTGIGSMFGAVSARNFGLVVLGCAIVFSAAWIVGQITGGTVGA